MKAFTYERRYNVNVNDTTPQKLSQIYNIYGNFKIKGEINMISETNVALKEKVGPKLSVFYSFGEVASNMSWYMINSYLTLFYTDVVGLAATAVSAVMLFARVFDTVFDPMMGMIADRTSTRWGKFRPYLIFAPPFLALFNILTFTVLPVTGIAKIILCVVCYTFCGIFYSVCNLTYGSLVNVIAKDSQVRMNLSTARGIASSICSIVLAAGVMPAILYFSHSKTANARGYLITNIILSIAMVIFFWLCVRNCKETYTMEFHTNKTEKNGFIDSLKSLLKNDQLTLVILCVFTGAIAVAGRMGLLAYYIIYVVGSYQAIAAIFTAITVAQLIGTLTIPLGTNYFGKKGYMIILNMISVISFIVLYLFPTNNMYYLLVVFFISGLPNCSGTICYGMVCDSIEYGDWKNGVREEGLATSYLSLSVKFATAICGSIGVLLLSASGYVANVQQTAAAKQGINFVVNIIPAICIVLSILPLIFYKLNDKRVSEIRAELDSREAKN